VVYYRHSTYSYYVKIIPCVSYVKICKHCGNAKLLDPQTSNTLIGQILAKFRTNKKFSKKNFKEILPLWSSGQSSGSGTGSIQSREYN
jgi:hypothetical protein